jgi:hypothetical protein
MRNGLGVKLILLALTLPMAAHAASLCDRKYRSAKSLVTQLKAAGHVQAMSNRSAGSDRNAPSVYYDSRSLTLWWVRETRSGAGIITCKQKVLSRAGLVDGGVQADCGAVAGKICTLQAHAMRRAKF